MNHLRTYEEFNFIFESNDKEGMIAKIQNVLGKIKLLPSKHKSKLLLGLATTLLSVMYTQEALDIAKRIKDSDFAQALISVDKEKNKKETSVSPFKPFDSLSLSKKGIEFIKDEEKLRLEAYDIKDGHITIGWGHAERKGETKLKVGDKITRQQAEQLLIQDLKEAENGIKRRINAWNKDIKMTQDQYDVLVSLAFNKGVSGLFNSDFIADIKEGKWITAGKKIRKAFKAGRFAKGHEKRRKKEANLFLSFLKNQNTNTEIHAGL